MSLEIAARRPLPASSARPWSLLGTILVAGLMFAGSGLTAANAARPNVLLIVSDDQGYPDLSCIGTKPVLTPHLDQLAARGVRATQFYVAWPACTPSRASILTGRYPQRNGLYDMVRNDMVNYGHLFSPEEYALSPEMTLGLDPREITLGDLMRRAGYRTGMVGKWDMGQARRYLPLQRGFDFFYGIGNNGIDYYTHERYGVPSMFRGNERTTADRGAYATDLFKREAVRFIAEKQTGPWFLYLAFTAPHSASSYAAEVPETAKAKKAKRPPGEGVQVPEKYAALYREKVGSEALARYYGAVTCMDEAIGEILAAIKQRGDEANTLVIFLSDNGGAGNGGNTPLRGAKTSMFEGGLRVPFIATWPGRIPAGRVCDEFLTTLELFPTLAQVAAIEPDPHVALDGFDLLPVLRGDTKSPRAAMFWQRRSDSAARVDQWKWIRTAQGVSLFDLAHDPGESLNLAPQKPDVARALEARFKAWRTEMDAAEPRGPFRDY